jgi:hypothetical protein
MIILPNLRWAGEYKMRGAAKREHFTVHASNRKLHDPKEAIFPIFRVGDDGLLHFLATGFFITRLGWFITAKHVVKDVLDKNDVAHSGLHVVQFQEGNIFYPRPVAGFTYHKLADVAVGVCAPMNHKITGEPLYNKVLTLNPMRLYLGCPVWTYAYPGTIVSHKELQNRIKIAPDFYLGVVEEYYQSGRDRSMLPAPCYRTTITLHAASSGGPVFGPGGDVVGVNSSSFNGAEDVSFISQIEDVFLLEVPDVLLPGEDNPRRVTIQELVKNKYISVR